MRACRANEYESFSDSSSTLAATTLETLATLACNNGWEFTNLDLSLELRGERTQVHKCRKWNVRADKPCQAYLYGGCELLKRLRVRNHDLAQYIVEPVCKAILQDFTGLIKAATRAQNKYIDPGRVEAENWRFHFWENAIYHGILEAHSPDAYAEQFKETRPVHFRHIEQRDERLAYAESLTEHLRQSKERLEKELAALNKVEPDGKALYDILARAHHIFDYGAKRLMAIFALPLEKLKGWDPEKLPQPDENTVIWEHHIPHDIDTEATWELQPRCIKSNAEADKCRS